MAHSNIVPKLYDTVVNDVISNVREAFLDEGVDDQVLLELKQVWEGKLQQSKALDTGPSEQEKLLQAAFTQQQKQTALLQQQQQQPQQPQAVAAKQQPAVVQTVQQPKAAVQPQQQVSVAQFPGQMHLQTTAGTLEMSGAAQAATLALPAGLYQQQLAALQGGTITIQGQDGQQYIIQAAPQGQAAATVLQPQVVATSSAAATTNTQGMIQLDGPKDTSSEDDDDDDGDDDKDDDNDDDQNDEDNEDQGEEEEPLNSDDDVKEDDPSEIFETDNVVVCQFDKINRAKNRWKFHLKDGIMNLNGKDMVFQRATGEAEW